MKLCAPCARGDHHRCRREVLAPVAQAARSQGLGGLTVTPCGCLECGEQLSLLEELPSR